MAESAESLTTYRLDKMDDSLASMHEKLDNIIKHQHNLDKRQAISEIKGGVFGTLGGSLSMVLLIFSEWFKTHFKN